MNINPIILSIPIYFLLIGVELVVQWITKKELYRLSDALTNISCGITQQLSGIFLKVLGVGAYVLVYEYFALFDVPSTWYTFIILFVGADFFYYWAHRMSHEINLFWGGHVVHHQSEDYNFSVALRQGSFQILWTFFFYFPLAIIGFKPVDFVFVSALVTVYQFWIHTETIGKMGWFEIIFNTPSHHRVHHGRNPKYIDRNHAGVFIIWDKMFGTFQEEEEKPTYGITKPINSWNPVWVNFDHYYQMFKQWKEIKGLKNKLKFLFYKPGWLPKELGGYQSAPEVDKAAYKKYDTPVNSVLSYYVLFQYIMILAATAVFLFNYTKLELPYQIVTVLGIILTIVNAGALMEKKSWAKKSEIIRVLLLTSIATYAVIFFSFSYLFLIPITVYFLISMFAMPYSSKLAV
ncbi:sterol desaturase family protein [Fulvivirga lutimaris]|uniref:sterol desaturase family protein n=1 Tax=Fulvivirga lutimaris TaxID=1819566 RepID=UPI0012BC5FA4|nr:sterol desaturase family protein [Fulvivirga lutimaris]MTI40116.1 fatty acid hydroxylase family protein [Fulvivirga lutimaris]